MSRRGGRFYQSRELIFNSADFFAAQIQYFLCPLNLGKIEGFRHSFQHQFLCQQNRRIYLLIRRA